MSEDLEHVRFETPEGVLLESLRRCPFLESAVHVIQYIRLFETAEEIGL
jgi:hypothetical protein